MPVYEYYCSACHTTFEALRSMADASSPATCQQCGGSQRTSRTITTFARISAGGGDGAELAPPVGVSGGGGCCGGACGCH